MEKSVLKTTTGKYVQIRQFRTKSQLCAVDTQVNDTFVLIQRREHEQKNQMSFHFLHQNECYSMKVNGTNLELEKVACARSGDLNDNHLFSSSENVWFEKTDLNSSQDYGLRTANKALYLTISGNRRSTFSLCNESERCVPITDEKAPNNEALSPSRTT